MIARRFHGAVLEALDALLAMPNAGSPKPTSNHQLAGLRSWHVNGFDEFRVYYLVQPDHVTVVRVLHGKRDIGTLLGRQNLEHP